MRIAVPVLASGLLVAAGARAQTPIVEDASPVAVRIAPGERADVVLQGRYLGSLEGATVLQGRQGVTTVRATLAPAGKDLTRRGVALEALGDATAATDLELVVTYTGRFRQEVRVETPVRIEIVTLPDLRFVECSFDISPSDNPDALTTGGWLYIDVAIKNEGIGPAIWPSSTGYIEAFHILRPWDYSGFVPPGTVLEPGRRVGTRAQLPLNLVQRGTEYLVSGEIDVRGYIEESDESDNQFTCPPLSR